MICLFRNKKPFKLILKQFNSLKTFKETFTALLFGLGGLIAGSIIVGSLSLILTHSWIILMYPLVLSTRGAINGVFCGKLGTGLQTRLIEPNFRNNSDTYYAIFAAVLSLSLISGIFASAITFVASSILYDVSLQELKEIFFTCVITKLLSVIITVPFASSLGFFTYKRGFNPEIFLYPISATIADIWTTISYILALELVFLSTNQFEILYYLFGLFFILLFMFLTIIFRNHEEYWKTIKESTLMILIVIPISTISGIFLSRIVMHMRRIQGLLIVYPALINTMGAAGAIFGSLSTTKLALGVIRAKFYDIKKVVMDFFQIGIAVLLVYILYGIIAGFVGGKILTFMIVLFSFIILFPIIMGISFTIGILTFQRGLDPDNFVIPIETTLTDSLLTVNLFILIALSSVT